jgi:hypothetical protein
VKQGAVTQTALVKLAVSSLLNYVLCKVFSHEFGLLIRKFSPTRLDGLPSAIESSGANSAGPILEIRSPIEAASGVSYPTYCHARTYAIAATTTNKPKCAQKLWACLGPL